MADDQPRTGTKYNGKTIPDPVDVRDLIYRPTLGLLPERFLCASVDPCHSAYRDSLTVRNQGDEPSCVGQSLATLVDIQRIEALARNGDQVAATDKLHPASGAMLYAMALAIEITELGEPTVDIYSLRSGLKGFYNTGVCTEDTWDARPLNTLGDNVESASVDAMCEARNVTLGAYYRVRSFINDYHAAIVEAGALYVSSELHDGWETPKDGVIEPSLALGRVSGGHAFVVVGYEPRGFLVLNSWGTDWGGYRLGDGPSLPGIALWTYADWAANVIDGWVLRLAAPTPEAFRSAIGPHGSAMFGADQAPLAAPSVRRLEVLGHYIHLDDGFHVKTGSYPGSRHSLKTTLDLLTSTEKNDITDIRLTIDGDITPTHEVLKRIANTIPSDKANGIYGISLLWVNGLLSGAANALEPLFDAALAVAKGDRDDADRRIEKVSRPVGRALWRDAKRSADTAAATRPNGDATHALGQLVAMCAKSGKRLHVVSEGAGILLLAALLQVGPYRDLRDSALSKVLASMTLVAPLITPKFYDASVGRFLEVWATKTGLQATMFRADAQLDARLHVGTYSRSWTDLVSRAFEEAPTRLVGAHDFAGPLRGNPAVRSLPAPDRPTDDLSVASVLQHARVTKHVADTIKRSQTDDPKSKH